jgi:hypothetical protein
MSPVEPFCLSVQAHLKKISTCENQLDCFLALQIQLRVPLILACTIQSDTRLDRGNQMKLQLMPELMYSFGDGADFFSSPRVLEGLTKASPSSILAIDPQSS